MQERLKPREYQKKGEKIVIKILTDRIREKWEKQLEIMKAEFW